MCIRILLIFDCQNLIERDVKFHIKFVIYRLQRTQSGDDYQGGGCIYDARDYDNDVVIVTIIS